MKFAIPILLLAVTACHAAQPEQPRKFADPAVAETLAEPIMSDMDLRAAASSDALRPADQPAAMQIPNDAIVDTRGAPTLGQVTAMRIRESAFSGCNPAIGYSAQWSVRLPDWMELPEGAHLVEAAGSDVPACGFRVVRFAIEGTPGRSLGRYSALAKQAGFAVRSKNGSLTAVRTRDGAAFRVDAIAIPNGTLIDLTSNRGR